MATWPRRPLLPEGRDQQVKNHTIIKFYSQVKSNKLLLSQRQMNTIPRWMTNNDSRQIFSSVRHIAIYFITYNILSPLSMSHMSQHASVSNVCRVVRLVYTLSFPVTITCSDVQVLGSNAVQLTTIQMETLTTSEFTDCTETLGAITSWSSAQLGVLATEAKAVSRHCFPENLKYLKINHTTLI